jgi:hydroxymethylbilane synthase
VSVLRIGTRGSKLALWQAEHLRAALAARCGVEAEIVIVKTTGDLNAAAPVEQLGTGVFTAELEQALIDGRADIAIHSMKDVPTDFSAACRIECVFEREDPRDVLISRSGAGLATLAVGARIGTSSLRRASQLRRARPDIEILEIRGNVDTRLRRLDDGAYDAIVLARAGVVRLGLAARITEVLPEAVVLPAVGQGALAAEYLAVRAEELRFVRKLSDRATALAVEAERGLQRELQAGCRLPLGAWARFAGDELTIDAAVLAENGEREIRGGGRAVCKTYAEALTLGAAVAREMMEAGAGVLLAAVGREVL